MIWFILGVTISFTRFKITRSCENIYCKTVPFFSLFFFFFLHLWFHSFKVNDLSTTITTTKKPWFSCVFPGEWKQTQGGEGGKERLVLLNFSLRVTLAPRVRLALSSVSLENRHLFCSLRHLSWKVSMVTAVLVLPCHAIRQITRSKCLKTIRSKISPKTPRSGASTL